MWSCERITYPTAKKEYNCDAYEWIMGLGLNAVDFTKEELEILDKVREENCKILPGTKYYKVVGRYDGEWTTMRARIDLLDIYFRLQCGND